MKQAVLVDAVRTPVGRYAGALRDVRPDDLAALVISELVARNKIDPNEIEDVILGCANQAGEDNRNIARMALLLAGLPVSVAGATVNRLCGSGLMAINDACRAVQTGCGDIFIAGGVESMSRAPLVMAKPDSAFPREDIRVFDTTIGWRFTNQALANKYHPYSMGETAENVADKYGISREDQDRFALSSQQKYAGAFLAGAFRSEIVPVKVPQKKGGAVIVSADEHPRPESTLDDLKKLKPAFRPNGSVTAGNSSGINDGAAAVLVMSAEKCASLGLAPVARYAASAVVGVDPAYMGLGPVSACRKALARTGLAMQDMDLVELNEAFAAQVLACVSELKMDSSKLNVNGGAIALGHPLGCSGARIMTTLLHEFARRKARRALAAMCIGVGQGIATIIESV